MKERLVIVIIAVGLGLFLTTIGFLIYQSTKFKPVTAENTDNQPIDTEMKITQAPKEETGLTVSEPKDEVVVDKRTLQVSGQTDPSYTVVISSNVEDVVANPDSKGKFAASITIDAGTNELITKAIKPDGTEIKDTRVVTYSTEEF
jgi:hypothetical protein